MLKMDGGKGEKTLCVKGIYGYNVINCNFATFATALNSQASFSSNVFSGIPNPFVKAID